MRTGRTGETVEGYEASILAMKSSPDSKTYITRCVDGSVRLWDLPDGHLRCTLRGHLADRAEAVLALAVSADGEMLATGATDRRICLYRLPGGQSLDRLQGHRDAV